MTNTKGSNMKYYSFHGQRPERSASAESVAVRSICAERRDTARDEVKAAKLTGESNKTFLITKKMRKTRKITEKKFEDMAKKEGVRITNPELYLQMIKLVKKNAPETPVEERKAHQKLDLSVLSDTERHRPEVAPQQLPILFSITWEELNL